MLELVLVVRAHVSAVLAVVVNWVVILVDSWRLRSDIVVRLLLRRTSLSILLHLQVILLQLFLSGLLHQGLVSHRLLKGCLSSGFFPHLRLILSLSMHLSCHGFLLVSLHCVLLALHRIHSLQVFFARGLFVGQDHRLMSTLVGSLRIEVLRSQLDWLEVIVAISFVQALWIRVMLSASILLLEIQFIISQLSFDFLFASDETVQILLSCLGLDLGDGVRLCLWLWHVLLVVDDSVRHVLLVVLVCLVKAVIQMTKNARLIFVFWVTFWHALVLVSEVVLSVLRHCPSCVSWVNSVRHLKALTVLVYLGSVDILSAQWVSLWLRS